MQVELKAPGWRLEPFFVLCSFLFFENGGDRFRRDMRWVKWHVEAPQPHKSCGTSYKCRLRPSCLRLIDVSRPG